MTQQHLFDPDPAPWELDAQGDQLTARIVFPQPPFGPYDYAVPNSLADAVEAGRRVRVPLGRGNRLVMGYCVATGLAADLPEKARSHLKPIRSVLDPAPLVSPTLLRLAQWLADYYVYPLGQVMEVVVPSGVRSRAGTRRVTFFRLADEWTHGDGATRLSPKQVRVVEVLRREGCSLPLDQLAQLAECSHAPIRTLQKKGVLVAEHRRVVTDGEPAQPSLLPSPPFALNDDQQTALDAIVGALRGQRHETILVHGVTGSGKTEVYMRAIEEVIRFGRQAIVLVPEISLTPQTLARFRARFAEVAVLHSHLSQADRNRQWQSIAAGQKWVVVGARSAVFAPTPHLGLIVMDEEHDDSFKQDTLLRYHARDVAIWRARQEKVPVVLGSATPSLESWHRAQQGDYRLVELPNRILNRPMPDVAVIDLRCEKRSRYRGGAISRPLRQAIQAALRDGGQVILLLNRRGFSTTIQCPSCGLVVRCPHCDIPLTHHRAEEQALCHYCDYQIPAPPRCPECGFDGIRYSGLGTQRLEAEVRASFPEATCLRMDSDSMRKPGSHEEAFERFRRKEVDILVGTQMIAKGLDIPGVTLVGVINADTALHFPDFRAAERTFQLVTQVAGRTGRGAQGGRVFVQTFSPEHVAITAAMRHDFGRFAANELPIRRQFGYPPYRQMIRLIIRGPHEEATNDFAEQLAGFIREALVPVDPPPRFLGPAPAPIAKLRDLFRFHLLIQYEKDPGLRPAIRQARESLKAPEDVLWIADVDPVDML